MGMHCQLDLLQLLQLIVICFVLGISKNHVVLRTVSLSIPLQILQALQVFLQEALRHQLTQVLQRPLLRRLQRQAVHLRLLLLRQPLAYLRGGSTPDATLKGLEVVPFSMDKLVATLTQLRTVSILVSALDTLLQV